MRLRVPADPVVFTDRIQGRIVDDLAESIGDFVIWRADELPAYQLAVVVDDAYQGVTEIVRGADLLHCTARQIHLQHCLSLPSPSYAHHPVALGPDGKKLSKRDGADPVAASTRERVLRLALNFLGQRCPGGLGLAETWEWAQDHWRLEAVPRQLALRLPQ